MLVFKALHVLSMFAMAAVFLSGAFVYAFAIRRRDVRMLATFHRTARDARLPAIGIVSLVLGIAFGFAAAVTGSFDVLDGWLIAAYVLVALFFVNFGLVGRDVIHLGDEAIEAEAQGRPADEITRDMAASRAGLFLGITVAIFAALVLDMVLKPF